MINKKMRSKINIVCAMAMAFALVLSGCSQQASTTVSVGTDTAAEAVAGAVRTAEVDISEVTAEVTLSDEGSTVSGTGVSVEGSDVVITSGGTFSFTGTLTEGRIKVEAEGETVQIVLNGVTIINSEKDAIYIEGAESAVIYVMEGTQNSLTSGTEEMLEEAKASVQEANETASDDEANGSGTGNETASEDAAASSDSDTDSEENSEEGLSNSQKAAVMAKCSLTVTGSGSLNVYGYINNGIQSKEDLYIDSVSLTVTASNDAVKGGTSVYVASGTFDLTAVGDAVQSDGTLEVADGSFEIKTGDGAASAEKKSDMSGGFGGGRNGGGFGMKGQQDGNTAEGTDSKFQAGSTTTDSSADFGTGKQQMPQGGAPQMADGERPEMPDGEAPQMADGERPEMPNGEAPQMTDGERPEMPDEEGPQMAGAQGSDSTDSGTDMQFGFGMVDDFGDSLDSDSNAVSQKGLKSEGDMTISGGSFVFDTVDDAVHSNGNLTIEDGEFEIQAGDDAVHAEAELVVNGGTINVASCYEGLEASVITVNDGDISVTASDDGFNASSSDTDPLITINGGNIYVDSDGDGLDSNKNIVINGGVVQVDGPANSGNSAIDIGSENQGIFVVNGGTITAVGMSGMLENSDESSSQQTLTYVFDESLEAGTTVTITDASGSVVAEFTTAKSADAVTYSSSELKSGETYTFTAGSLSGELTADAVNATNYQGGTGMGMGFGGKGGR